MNFSWKCRPYESIGGFKCRRIKGFTLRFYKKGRDEKKFGKWIYEIQDDWFTCFSFYPFTIWFFDFPDRKYVSDQMEREK